MRCVKPDNPEQRLELQSVNVFEDRVFEAKARQPRGQDQSQDHGILSSSCPNLTNLPIGLPSRAQSGLLKRFTLCCISFFFSLIVLFR